MNVAVLSLSERQARTILKQAVSDSSLLILTSHAKDRMLQRGISKMQVLKALDRGQFVEGPVWVNTRSSHEMALEYYYGGDRVKVVSAIPVEFASGAPVCRKVVVITVIALA